MLGGIDKKWLVGLAVVGVLTRLIGLNNPSQVVFDEVHFGKFITAYCCSHERIFDIHPPHAKLLVAGTAYLFGFRGGYDFDHISEPYGAVPVVALRLLPAMVGIVLPLIIYGLMRQLRSSAVVAGLAGMALTLDNALIVQSRLISLDGILLVATFGALSAFLASGLSKGRVWMGWSALSGALAGLAVGTKFTGLAIVGLLGLLMAARQFGGQGQWKRFFGRTVLVLLGFALIYLGGWGLHFWLLNQPGPGDAWRVSVWDGWLPAAFMRETIAWHRLMLAANYNLTATHPFASVWWSWPLMLKPIFYWQGSGGRMIYFLGNPVVWWGSTLLLVAAVSHGIWRRRWPSGLGVALTGWGLALLPFIQIPRALFMYHYLTALVFAVMFGGLWLEQRRHVWLMWLLPLLAAGWLLLMPVTYGLAVPGWWQAAARWLL